MSNKMQKEARKRSYVQRERARRRDAVHLRITKAAVELHGSVGPARTTMAEIAKLAGVRRATVYNHFPTDSALFGACSSHWFGEHPPPDPAAWARIADPELRVQAALEGMYEYYEQGREMLGNVMRDAAVVPALAETIGDKWFPLMEATVETLAEGLAERRTAREDAGVEQGMRATLKVALDFFTWQTLTATGLSSEAAARLAAAWVTGIE